MTKEQQWESLANAVASAESTMLRSYQDEIVPRMQSFVTVLIWVLMYINEGREQMKEKMDIERVGDRLIELVTDRQFQLLFEAADVPCPPEEFQTCDDPAKCWLGERCLACWREYTKLQALLDVGILTRIERAMGIYAGACDYEKRNEEEKKSDD